MGPTKTSKLLAVKRPHLIPIYDDWVARALWSRRPVGSYWNAWAARFAGDPGHALQHQVESLRAEAGVCDDISILRVLDIVIWMWARQRRSRAWDLGQQLR